MALLKVLLLVLVNSDVSRQKRIIGGRKCDDSERLYHVRLESSNGYERIRCGGSLVHPQWILTAARCYKSEPGWTNIAMLKVHPRTIIRYHQVIRQAPEIYDEWHDIALLKLEIPIRDVPLGQLPSCNNHLKVGDTVQLAGEGAMITGPNNKRLTASAIPSHLQCVNMKVVAVSTFLQTRGHIFLTEAPNKDICYADAGGAAMYNGKIYGVISFFGADYACQQSTVIMDVCEYLEWIKQKTGLV